MRPIGIVAARRLFAWSDDVVDVTRYLNEIYYRFSAPGGTLLCRGCRHALAPLALAGWQMSALSALGRRFAWTKPCEYEGEHSYRALQALARAILATPQMSPLAQTELRGGARP